MDNKVVEKAFEDVIGVLKVLINGEMLPVDTVLYIYLKLYKELNIELKIASRKEQNTIMELAKKRFPEIGELVEEVMEVYGRERFSGISDQNLETVGSSNVNYLSEHIKIEREKLGLFIRKESRRKGRVKKTRKIRKD